MFFQFSQPFLIALYSHTETSGHHRQASGIEKIIPGAFSSSKNIIAYVPNYIIHGIILNWNFPERSVKSLQNPRNKSSRFNMFGFPEMCLDFPKCIWICFVVSQDLSFGRESVAKIQWYTRGSLYQLMKADRCIFRDVASQLLNMNIILNKIIQTNLN